MKEVNIWIWNTRSHCMCTRDDGKVRIFGSDSAIDEYLAKPRFSGEIRRCKVVEPNGVYKPCIKCESSRSVSELLRYAKNLGLYETTITRMTGYFEKTRRDVLLGSLPH